MVTESSRSGRDRACAVGCPEGDDGGERAWRAWAGGMQTGSVSDSDMEVLVTGRRRRVVTVVQWHAAARARMVIALGWVMHDRYYGESV